jgi:hypothetical protein
MREIFLVQEVLGGAISSSLLRSPLSEGGVMFTGRLAPTAVPAPGRAAVSDTRDDPCPACLALTIVTGIAPAARYTRQV